MSRTNSDHVRPLLPASEKPESPFTAQSALVPRPPRVGVSIACENCRKRKIRCSGSRPKCVACINTGHECIYTVATKDHELKRKYDDLESESMAYQKLVELLRSREHNEANLILELIRQTTHVHEVLRQVEHGDMLCDLALVPETRYRYAFPFRQTLPDYLQSRDNPYLHSPIYEWPMGGGAQPRLNIPSSGFDPSQPPAPFLRPYHAAEVMVPGLDSVKPSRWTSVCSDNVLMRKILRAYFLHDYEWFTFFHKDYFFQDMAAGKRRFCSPLLVNALFALATYCYHELPFRLEYWNPHTLGYKFLAEARRLWEVEEAGPTNRLTTLQAGLLLNVVYDMMGADRIGWKYTLRAVAIANSLNLFDAPDRTRSKNLQHARDFTAWALFSWQSQRSYHFSRTPIITSPPTVPLPDPTQCPQWYGEVWIKYPQNPCIFSSNFGYFFKAKAEFLVILNEISLQCFWEVGPQGVMTEQNLSTSESRLENWYNSLPYCLSPTKIALPAHLKLHMYYYFVLINIHRPIPGRTHPKPPQFSPTGDCDESKTQDVFIDAFIRFETLFRIYYLRHGFDRIDILLLPYLVFEAFTNLNQVEKCANPSHLNSLQSTLLLAAKGLREQGRIYFLAKAMFQLVYRDMRPEEMELFGRFVTLGEEACQPDIRTDFIHSDWPVKLLGFGDDSENKSLNELVKEYDDLSCGSTEEASDEEEI